MKKKTLLAPMALAIMAIASPAFANDGASVPPLDAGIVVDVSGGGETVDVNAMVTDQAEQQAVTPTAETEVKSNDGTSLPLDQNAGGVGDIDSGQEISPSVTEPEVISPEQDTVVLTEKVEPLPQTGLDNKGILYAGLTVMLAVGLLVLTRFKKVTAE